MTGKFTWERFKKELVTTGAAGGERKDLQCFVALVDNGWDEQAAAASVGMGKNVVGFIGQAGRGFATAGTRYQRTRLNVGGR